MKYILSTFLLLCIYMPTSAQVTLDQANSAIEIGPRLTLQYGGESVNGWVRGFVGSTINWNLTTDKWDIGRNNQTDFSMMKFANNGAIVFYSGAGNGNNYSLLDSELTAYARLSITNSGNLGIGTTTPKFNLDIETDDRWEGNNLYFGNKRLYLAGFTGTGSQMYGGLVLTNQGSGVRSLDFVVGNNDFDTNISPENLVMTIQSNGNVGIGEVSPDSKLAVNGTIHTKEVKVDLVGWSDFVFEDDYVLRTLEETENFIATNKHLPEIPNEETVINEGINLGEMDAKLLQKIEELTLYLIQQNKQNQSQQELIEQLQKEVSALKKE